MCRALAVLAFMTFGGSQVGAETVKLLGVFPDETRLIIGCVQLKNGNIVGGGEVIAQGGAVRRLRITSGSYVGNVVTLQGHYQGTTITFQIQAMAPNGPINVSSNGQTSQAHGKVIVSW